MRGGSSGHATDPIRRRQRQRLRTRHRGRIKPEPIPAGRRDRRHRFPRRPSERNQQKKRTDQIVKWLPPRTSASCPTLRLANPSLAFRAFRRRRSRPRRVISIRGFGPDFSMTLLNGREQTLRPVTIARSNLTNFLRKSLTRSSSTRRLAAIIGQGLVGTIDLRTIRPLELRQAGDLDRRPGCVPEIGKLNRDAKKYHYLIGPHRCSSLKVPRLVPWPRAGPTSHTNRRSSTPGVMLMLAEAMSLLAARSPTRHQPRRFNSVDVE